MKLYDEYPQALRVLHGELNLANKTESLRLYSAIKVIADEFHDVIEANKEDFPQQGLYLSEKIGLFVSGLKLAVMPVENSSNTPQQWLEIARQNLEKVEMSGPDRKSN